MWSLPSGGLAATLQAADAKGIVYGVAFSPDGRLLATTANSLVVHLWDVETRRLLATLGKQRGSVLSVAFSHDGKTLASMAGYPYALDTPAELTLWDVASQTKLAALVGHTSSGGWLDFSPDDRLLATPHGNGTILLWDLGSRTIVGHLPATRGWSSACGSHRMVSCWHPEASMAPYGCGTRRHAARSPRSGPTREPCTLVAFSPDGDRLISGGLDHTAKLWDVEGRRAVTTFRGHLSRIFSVSYAPDGKTVATASLDGTAKTWDATAHVETEIFEGTPAMSAYVRFSPDGRLLARSDLRPARSRCGMRVRGKR